MRSLLKRHRFNMVARSKADRLGLTLVEPVESVNGETGDVALY
jgi:hypothetical protein